MFQHATHGVVSYKGKPWTDLPSIMSRPNPMLCGKHKTHNHLSKIFPRYGLPGEDKDWKKAGVSCPVDSVCCECVLAVFDDHTVWL